MFYEIVHRNNIPEVIFSKVSYEIGNSIKKIITTNDKFIVNDTPWFWETPKGLIKPSVVNSAKFITSKFAENIESFGWVTEKTLDNQTIDGYKKFKFEGEYYSLPEEKYFIALENLKKFSGGQLYGKLATTIFNRYVAKSSPYLMTEIKCLESLFVKKKIETTYSIGLEFETGNIASSFRAFQKLDNLYKKNFIDAGVFITSIDKKNCTARIWPSSNRNGSFEELMNRNYKETREAPFIDFGFKPDLYSKEAMYLSEDGTLYEMDIIGEIMKEDGLYIEAKGFGGVKRFRKSI